MKEALEFTLERERDEPGSFLVEPAVAHPGDEAALIRRRPDGTWHAVLDGAPNITAVGDSPDQVAYLIAEAAAAYRELQDDEPALPESEFEAALVRAAAVAPA
jgi:predicted RNase H-like HicB family nuclease